MSTYRHKEDIIQEIEMQELRNVYDAIRKHRDSWLRGDDKCWKDNIELYKLLPEGFELPENFTDTFVELENCIKYIKSCHHPDINYVSPQRRIEELKKEIERLKNEQ